MWLGNILFNMQMCVGVYRFGEDKLCELNVCEMSVGFPNEDDQWTVKILL